MITKQRTLFYFVGDRPFKDLADAQRADLVALIPDSVAKEGGGKADLAEWLLANAEAISTILTTTPRSRIRKPRKDKGVPRKRTEEVKP